MNIAKPISVIIFDCDGVMFDSRKANINYYNHLLGHFGLPLLTEKQVSFVHQHTGDESVRYIFQGTPYFQEAQIYRREIDFTPFIRDMIIEPGLKELLKWLKPQFGLAVATNRSDTMGKVIELHGLEGYFDIVVSSLDVKQPKPHPEAIFKILDHFKIGPEQSLYMGDSLVDWETARAAGVVFVSYKNEILNTPLKIRRLSEIRNILNAMGEA